MYIAYYISQPPIININTINLIDRKHDLHLCYWKVSILSFYFLEDPTTNRPLFAFCLIFGIIYNFPFLVSQISHLSHNFIYTKSEFSVLKLFICFHRNNCWSNRIYYGEGTGKFLTPDLLNFDGIFQHEIFNEIPRNRKGE